MVSIIVRESVVMENAGLLVCFLLLNEQSNQQHA
jgi:hypothetical protein